MKSCKCPLICLIFVTIFVYGRNQRVANRCGNLLPCDDLRQCIARESWCDEEIDCQDGSDENYCKKRSRFDFYGITTPNNCDSVLHFKCGNGFCVPQVTVCDGYNNCKDNSDEYNCEEILTSGSPSEENEDFDANFSTFKSIFSDENLEESSTLPPREIPETTPFTTATSTSFTDQRHARTQWTSTTTRIPRTAATTRTPRISTTTRTPRISTTTRTPWTSTTAKTPWTSTTLDYYAWKMTEGLNQRRSPTHYDNGRNSVYIQYGNNQYIYPDAQTHNKAPVTVRSTERTYVTQSSPILVHTIHSQYPIEASVLSVVPPSTSFRAEHDSSRMSSDSYPQPQTHFPRAVRLSRKPFHSPAQFPQATATKRTHPGKSNGVLPPFYFQWNYTYQFGSQYRDAVQRAEQWFLDRRDGSYGWGKDTPRALVALSLISNSFSTNITENDLMKKGLQVNLGIQLLNRITKPLSNSRWALYINALLATCQNPRDFHGQDLTEILSQQWRNSKTTEARWNPLVYLTLCLTNSSVSRTELRELDHLLNSTRPDERSKDMQILATTALACFQQQEEHRYDLRYKVNDAFNSLLRKRRQDGSFGSAYSTALAVQALISINSTSSWDPNRSIDYLLRHQLEDGSFGDVLATYYVLPVLSGRSLLHLRNTHCDPSSPDKENIPVPPEGPRIYVTLKVGYPETFSTSVYLTIPQETNFFAVMREAQRLNSNFRFLYTKNNGDIDIHTISDIPNDTERRLRWYLYTLDNSKDHVLHFDNDYKGNILELYPKDGQELIFWYLRLQ